jgi:hypothetical protein
MVVARLQAEWSVVSVKKMPVDPAAKDELLKERTDFKASVAWVAGEVELWKKSKRKFTQDEQKVVYLVSLESGSVTQRYSGEAVVVSSKCTESAMMKVLYAFECRNWTFSHVSA